MSENAAHVSEDAFGRTAAGAPIARYTLRNARGAMARVITYGATVTELWMPDRHGALADVVLGFDRLAQYETESPYFGCMVGRVAFRIANSEFQLDGQTYHLTQNDGPHHLHGGVCGFGQVVWQAEVLADRADPTVRFTYRSPDGDQGYPGALDAAVTYTLTADNALLVDCTAATDRPTPINLAHHSYFNLAGQGCGDILGHVLQLDADQWMEASAPDIPSGRIVSAADTPFDFRTPTPIGRRIHDVCGSVPCYDLAYLVNRQDDELVRTAAVQDPHSGRHMEVLTTAPAVVLYTGNYLDGTLRGKSDASYPKYAALCLETGHLPDSVHHPNFPSTILRPGQTYRHTCMYRFSTV